MWMTHTILVIDDSEVVRKLVHYQLTDAGYTVLAAEDGAMGLKMLKEHTPDLVILDVQMPEMDGYEVCRRLRQIHGLSHIPVIMVTALSTINSMQAGFEAGADDYITKPFKPAELQMRVNAILRRAATGGSATLEPETSTIAVFSLRGGTGCTSFAVNLAIGLSRLWGTNGILLDLDLPLGSCEILMDLQPKQSLSTLIQHDISSLDEVLIGGHLTKHYSGTQLFAGIFNPADSDFITENIVSLVLDHLQSLSRYVIVDTAHNFSAQTLAVLEVGIGVGQAAHCLCENGTPSPNDRLHELQKCANE
jgi:CheY-like chemotaxis protein